MAKSWSYHQVKRLMLVRKYIYPLVWRSPLKLLMCTYRQLWTVPVEDIVSITTDDHYQLWDHYQFISFTTDDHYQSISSFPHLLFLTSGFSFLRSSLSTRPPPPPPPHNKLAQIKLDKKTSGLGMRLPRHQHLRYAAGSTTWGVRVETLGGA